VKGVDDLDALEIKPDERLVCLTSGGLTRHVMPFSVAEKAFQTLQKKQCQLFIGGGLEPLWLNGRMAKNLGFKLTTTDSSSFSDISSEEDFGSRRLTLLEPLPRVLSEDPEVFSLRGSFLKPDFSAPDREDLCDSRELSALEEGGYLEKAFSTAFLFRCLGSERLLGRFSSVSLPELPDPTS
jgi:hypothetical protein